MYIYIYFNINIILYFRILYFITNNISKDDISKTNLGILFNPTKDLY